MRGVASTAHFNQCWATLSILKYTMMHFYQASKAYVGKSVPVGGAVVISERVLR